MPIVHIFTGTTPNDGTGEPLRDSFIICNDNFDFLDDERLLMKTDIDDLETDMIAAQSDISTLETTVAGHTTSISTINSTLTSLDTRLDSAEATILSLDSRLDTIEPIVSSHTTSISTINSTLTSLDSRLDSAELDIDNLQTTTAGHTSSIATINGTLVSLDSRLDTAEADIAALEGVDTSYGNRLDALEAEDIVIDGRLDDLETDVADHETRITTLEGATVDLSDAVILEPATATRNVIVAQATDVVPLTLVGAISHATNLLTLGIWNGIGWSSDTVFDEAGRLAIGASDPGTNLLHVQGSSSLFEVLSTGIPRASQLDIYNSANLDLRLEAAGVNLKSTGVVNWSSTGAASGTADTGLAHDGAGVLRVSDGSTGTAGLVASNFSALNSSNLDALLYDDGLAVKDTGTIAWSSTGEADGSVQTQLGMVGSALCVLDSTGATLAAFAADDVSFATGLFEDGSVGAPSISFNSANTTGFYRTAGALAVSYAGSACALFNASGITATGGLSISSGGFNGSITTTSPASGTHNNYAITPALIVDIDTSAGNATLTGISVSGATNGQLMLITKSGGNSLTLNHNDAASSVGNRFAMAGGVNISVTAAHHLILLQYTGSVWRAGKIAP